MGRGAKRQPAFGSADVGFVSNNKSKEKIQEEFKSLEKLTYPQDSDAIKTSFEKILTQAKLLKEDAEDTLVNGASSPDGSYEAAKNSLSHGLKAYRDSASNLNFYQVLQKMDAKTTADSLLGASNLCESDKMKLQMPSQDEKGPEQNNTLLVI